MRRLEVLITLGFALASCKAEAPPAAEIPASMHGHYGRTSDDAFGGTQGLTVEATKLRFGKLTIDVQQGKPLGGEYQIIFAESSWAEQDELGKKCTGTISRQGPRLLLTLFDRGTDKACELALHGSWTKWGPVEALPDEMRGTFGSSRAYAKPVALTFEEKAAHFTDGGEVKFEEFLTFEGRTNEVVIASATFENRKCHGRIVLDGDSLSLELKPSAEDAEYTCPAGRGERWKVEGDHLPREPLSNGNVRIEAKGGLLEVRSVAGEAVCRQKILRTRARSTHDGKFDRLPVTGGNVLVLEPGALEGGESCVAECPSHVIIGDATSLGLRAALMPQMLFDSPCFDMSGNFEPGK